MTTLMRDVRRGWTNTNHATDAKTIGEMETLDGLGYITTGIRFIIIGMVAVPQPPARAAASLVPGADVVLLPDGHPDVDRLDLHRHG